MTRNQKIIAGVASLSALILIITVITVVSNKKKANVNTMASSSSKVQLAKDDSLKKPIEPVEKAVIVQTAEETSEEQLEEEKVDVEQVKTGKATYYIRVNYGTNTVTIYGKDENDEYTVPVKAMICSCGISTPKSGVYRTSNGYRWGTLIGGVYGQYSTRIVGNILFHSVPYTAQSPDSLEYWEFDKLGTSASAGCVRLMVADARWIYYNCEAGTMVEFYSSGDPGPLGKPSAPIISGNERCRDWDPTDPTEGNPWFDEIQEEPAQEQPQVQPEPEKEQEKPTTSNTANRGNNSGKNNNSNNNSSSQNKPTNTVSKPENKVTNTVTNTTPPSGNKPENTAENTTNSEETTGGEQGEQPGNENPGEGGSENPGGSQKENIGGETGENLSGEHGENSDEGSNEGNETGDNGETVENEESGEPETGNG